MAPRAPTAEAGRDFAGIGGSSAKKDEAERLSLGSFFASCELAVACSEAARFGAVLDVVKDGCLTCPEEVKDGLYGVWEA